MAFTSLYGMVIYINKLSVAMKDENIDEVALIRGIASGDLLIANELYKQVFPRLSRVAFWHVKNEQVAWDIVADVFVHLIKEGKEFENCDHLMAVLYKRVRWTSQDRAKSLRKGIVITALTEEAATEDSVEDDIVRAEHLNAIKEAMEALPPQYREVLEAYFFKGKKIAEIARILNINAEKVSLIKIRAIKRLQAILANKNLIIILLLFFPPG